MPYCMLTLITSNIITSWIIRFGENNLNKQNYNISNRKRKTHCIVVQVCSSLPSMNVEMSCTCFTRYRRSVLGSCIVTFDFFTANVYTSSILLSWTKSDMMAIGSGPAYTLQYSLIKTITGISDASWLLLRGAEAPTLLFRKFYHLHITWIHLI